MSLNYSEKNVSEALSRYSEQTESLLRSYFPDPSQTTDSLGSGVAAAMSYSLFAGGKRLRPALVLAASDMFGGSGSEQPLAAAVEMIHTYSLIHDDLPCMDDDDLRRGRPSCHVVYGYASALLAGDALLNLAYETIFRGYFTAENKERYMSAAADIARAAGISGMCGGQGLDIVSDNLPKSAELLQSIQRGKTGALLTACVVAGAAVAGADNAELELMRIYGEAIGEMFQIVDDVLDLVGDAESLGKNVNVDADNGTLTYPSLFGIEGSRQKIAELCETACGVCGTLGSRADFFADLAEYLAQRTK